MCDTMMPYEARPGNPIKHAIKHAIKLNKTAVCASKLRSTTKQRGVFVGQPQF